MYLISAPCVALQNDIPNSDDGPVTSTQLFMLAGLIETVSFKGLYKGPCKSCDLNLCINNLSTYRVGIKQKYEYENIQQNKKLKSKYILL